MADTQGAPRELGGSNILNAVSNAMVSLHKEQFGRGPTRARSNFAGSDTLVCLLEDALLPAEHAMVRMGDNQRVIESRMYLQTATTTEFVETIEELVHRTVRAFASAVDPEANVVWEIFTFEAIDVSGDGHGPVTT
jgi:uncharacterized protein YbcI